MPRRVACERNQYRRNIFKENPFSFCLRDRYNRAQRAHLSSVGRGGARFDESRIVRYPGVKIGLRKGPCCLRLLRFRIRIEMDALNGWLPTNEA